MIVEKTEIVFAEIRLMGIQVKTHYQNELNPLTSKIAQTVQRYWQEGIANQLVGRINPGRTFAVYTDYSTDHTGEYTYFLGEEVVGDRNVPDGLFTLMLSAGKYTRFTTQPAPLPHVIIDGWYNIWQMTAEEMGGERKFGADFEIYDERAQNPLAAVVDIYIGLK